MALLAQLPTDIKSLYEISLWSILINARIPVYMNVSQTLHHVAINILFQQDNEDNVGKNHKQNQEVAPGDEQIIKK